MPTVFFYISGHGFGHAVRQIEIINTLLHAAPGVRVVVRTAAPEWLFTRTIRGPFTLLPGETDTGVVQIDALRLDADATVTSAAAFYDGLPHRIEREAALLRASGAQLVVADAPPLACAAAREAGIASAVCSNFTWDWIYEEYAGRHPSGPDVLATVREAYRGAAGWRMPFHGGFEPTSPVIDVPLVARRSRAAGTSGALRERLTLPAGVPLVLVSFGGYGADDLPLDRLDCVDRWGVVLTVRGDREAPRRAGLHVVTESALYGCGLRYEDLVRAVDVVLTKPGYGIVSDCIANGTAVLYTSRGRFREYEVLVREMPRFLRCAYLPMDRLMDGRWAAGLEEACAAPPPAEHARTDGAEAVAALILERAATSPR